MSAPPPPFTKRLKRRLRFELIRAAVVLVGLWPARLASGVGAALGALAYWLAGGERRKALASLAVAFPERSPAERQALARACFRHLGRCALEAVCVRQVDRAPAAWVDWPPEARAVLDQALARKKGVLFVSGHVGHWELLARHVAMSGYPAQTIAKETTDDRLTALVERFRAQGRLKAIWRGRPGAVKDMLRALKQGEILGMLIDQDTQVQSVFVPFFGHLASTPRAAADLALRTGAAVVLGFCQRSASGRYVISMREVPLPPGDGDEATTALTASLTQGIEEAIRAHPEQWVWMHRRWRTRPEGAPAVSAPA